MRHVYLKQAGTVSRGCRGGVSATGPFSDYELEIHHDSNASTAMLAHCALIDEIHEYLRLQAAAGSRIAEAVLQRFQQSVQQLDDACQSRPLIQDDEG